MKKVFILISLIMIMFAIGIGCVKQETYENGVPTYFLEPEGYVIAKVKLNDSNILVGHYLYGYISEEDYQLYLNGNMEGMLVVKHPCEEGREVSTPFREIMTMEVGVYEVK